MRKIIKNRLIDIQKETNQVTFEKSTNEFIKELFANENKQYILEYKLRISGIFYKAKVGGGGYLYMNLPPSEKISS